MQYLKAVSKFYEAAVNPDLWPDALEAIAEATGSRGALLTAPVFMPGGPVFLPGGLAYSQEMTEAVEQFFEQSWYANDVRTVKVKDHHFHNGFFTDHTLFTDSDMARSEYYEKFARSADVPWFAAGRLAGDLTTGAVSISLQRSAAQGYFTPQEVADLNTLLPHLQPSMMLASKMIEAKGRALMDGLQMAKQPAVLLRPNGTVAFANAAAESLLGSHVFIRNQRLGCSSTLQNQQLQALISQACQAVTTAFDYRTPLRPVTLPASETESRLVITAAPIRRSGAEVVAFSGVIVMITDTSFGVRLSAAILQSLFDLTSREATIMSCIGQGQSLKQAAQNLNLSHETVRHHLKSIFSKTGTRQQSELVALCTKLYPALGE